MKRIAAFLLALTMSFTLISCYSESDIDDARQEGYDEGYEIGYDEGYDAGYSEAEYDNGENDLSGYLGTHPNASDTFLTTDTAPEGTVWVTPHGEKYHEGWCRYISGRNDLTYFYSTDDAENAGYAPCSVCQ